MEKSVKELKGANMDIDLTTDEEGIDWKHDKCPWNEKEGINKHKCAVKNTSICKYFKGIRRPDKVLCNYPTDEI